MSNIKLTIDGKQVEVEPGTTIFKAAEKAGSAIPHYCYHPGLSLAGNCRMCLVEVEKMPKPLASCVAPVAEGMVVHTNTKAVIDIRKSVMEFLLINHPLDCPTCDQAGECRLQDYYMMHDRVPSRFHEEKVHKDKMVDLGANVMLDQERCIACTRCIRVCQEVAGVDELTLANRGDHVTITTFPGKNLQNPYAGNTVDVCPVGALTSKEFRFQKRVWFLKSAPSVCTGCSRGCNITVQQDNSVVYRLLPRTNLDVNQYWICDEGRHGYHFVNQDRLLRARVTEKGQKVEATAAQAVDRLASLLVSYKQGEVAMVGHAGETLEALEAVKLFSETTLGESTVYFSRFDPPHPTSDEILRTADKNPNQASVDRLGFKPLSELKNIKGIIALRALKDEEVKTLDAAGIKVLGFLAVNDSLQVLKAEVALPIPSFAEQQGHLINVDGRVQEIKAAFKPRGESRLVVEWLKDLSVALSLLRPEAGDKEQNVAV